MANSRDNESTATRLSKPLKALSTPLPDRWRPFSGFVGGIVILAVLTIVGRYDTDAWRFFALYTAVAAVVGIVWAIARSRRTPSADGKPA